MTKQKTFRSAPRLLSNSNRLTTSGHDSVQVEIRQEPLDSPGIGLNDIPAAPTPTVVVPDGDQGGSTRGSSRGKGMRGRSKKRKSPAPATEEGGSDSDSAYSDPYAPALKRQKTPVVVIPDGDTDSLLDPGSEAEDDDKKKLGLETAYEGFNIYGRILCIVVKRHGATGRRPGAVAAPAAAARGKVMEEWISMSQSIKDGDAE